VIQVLERHPRLWITLAVISPLLLAAAVLYGRHWIPLLDMVMTEFRVRDVGGPHTPLIGLPGRIGDFPNQGSHPGPWSFYLVAPFYRLAGSTPWGMQLASVVLNSACISGIVYLGHRRYGVRGAVVFAALAALAIRGYGLNVLTHPWNPYFGVLMWMLAAIAAWFVLAGDWWMAVIVVVATNLAAQTHVPYLPSAIALNALVVGWLGSRIVLARRDQVVGPVRPLVTTLVIGIVFWLPPIVQQLRDEPGNIVRLMRHFATEQPEESIGLTSALQLVSQHFDVVALAKELVVDDDAFLQRASQAGSFSLIGILVLVAWALCAGWAIRHRHHDLMALHAVTAIGLVAGWISISRIFGRVWFYLTLWMSSTVLLAIVGIAWTTWILVRQRRAERGSAPVPERPVTLASAAIGAFVTVLSLVAAVGQQEPNHVAADGVRNVLPSVVAALEAHEGTATGKQGTYMLFWQESVFPGSQSFGLLGELDRRGYRIGVDDTWRVPATPQRVLAPGSWDSEIHLVSGPYIDEWRARDDQELVEVVVYDRRTAAERQRFDELAARVDRRLVEVGRGDMVPNTRLNLLGAWLTPGLPDDVVDDLGEMLDLGQPIAVFIAPPGAFLDGIARRAEAEA
jgi:hypothetical protein